MVVECLLVAYEMNVGWTLAGQGLNAGWTCSGRVVVGLPTSVVDELWPAYPRPAHLPSTSQPVGLSMVLTVPSVYLWSCCDMNL